MLRLLADENFNFDIVRGLRLRKPDLDIVSVFELGLSGTDDPALLAWAAKHDRVLLTHDCATMSDHAYERVAISEPMPGVFLLNDRFPVGKAIEEILITIECSEQAEWNGRVVHLPL